MNFFISDAMAQSAGGGGAGLGTLLFPVLMLVIMYFLLIKPQQKRAKEAKALVEGLKKGDEVVTSGGLLGRITKVGDNFITLEAGEGVELRVHRQYVQSLMPKGTIKEL